MGLSISGRGLIEKNSRNNSLQLVRSANLYICTLWECVIEVPVFIKLVVRLVGETDTEPRNCSTVAKCSAEEKSGKCR